MTTKIPQCEADMPDVKLRNAVHKYCRDNGLKFDSYSDQLKATQAVLREDPALAEEWSVQPEAMRQHFNRGELPMENDKVVWRKPA